MKLLITGGCGFIGSTLCRYCVQKGYEVYNIDKLTYSGSKTSLISIENSPLYHFFQLDICDKVKIQEILQKNQIDAIIHLAAESHVDRSISGPEAFINTNIVGTFMLLEAARFYWQSLPLEEQKKFRFYHISTDEVFGDLPFDHGFFSEDTAYCPSSPYAASKAASDHLVRAWHHTYGLPVLLSNCSNNYGPYQFPEKLIPLMIITALSEQALPIYGEGKNIRDWLYVDDHVRAIETILLKGTVGESYNVGTHNEQTNLNVVKQICSLLDEIKPRSKGQSYHQLICFVKDRSGHDRRYAIDAKKIETELSWQAKEHFHSGLKKTVEWYLNNEKWWKNL